MSWKPKLRTVLLVVNLIVFLLPIVAIATLRIYESELIRRTEAELLSQGAMIQASYKQALLSEFRQERATSKIGDGPTIDDYGVATDVHWPKKVESWLKPVPASINLADEPIQPPAPQAKQTETSPEPYAVRAGKRIIPQLRDAQEITLSGMQVVDYNGTVVAATGMQVGMSLAHRDEVSKALEGEFVQVLRDRDYGGELPPLDSISRRSDVRVFVTMPIVHGDRLLGAAVLSRTPMSLMKAIYRHSFMFGGALIVVIFGVISISIITSHFINQPIGELIEQSERIASGEGDTSATIEQPATEEFAKLSQAFAQMATTIEKRSDYIETFARNVSHEFKTPLSSIRGTVELLRDHWGTMEEEKREEFLEMLDADRERLQRLTERLLELARADVLEPGSTSTNLTDTIAEMRESLPDIEVDDSDLSDDLEVAVGPESLAAVLRNLIENAHQHGATRVTIRAEAHDDDRVSVVVEDDGPGISEGNAERVFDAFFTTTREAGGTGLGLAIVASLLEAHGGDIELVDGSGGAAFQLVAPGGV